MVHILGIGWLGHVPHVGLWVSPGRLERHPAPARRRLHGHGLLLQRGQRRSYRGIIAMSVHIDIKHIIPQALPRRPRFDAGHADAVLRERLLGRVERIFHWLELTRPPELIETIGEALAQRLQQSDAPEVVVVMPQRTGGWLEQHTMDVLRARLVKQLREADRHRRLRLYYPQLSSSSDAALMVHAKVMIVDDRLLRVASSNLSNRSMGLDCECDLAIEADADSDTQQAIRTFREQLLAEHLGETWSMATLPQADRDRLRENYQRFQNLSPEEKKRIRSNYQRFRELQQDRRQELRERFRDMTPEQRQQARKRYNALKDLSPDQRQALRQRWQDR